MNLDNNILTIDTSLNNSNIDELLTILKDESLEEIVIKNEDLSSSIIQVLWCVYNEKRVTIEVESLKPFFENVQYSESV